MLNVFYSETHVLHDPPFEVFDGGVRTTYLEMPERVRQILSALRGTDWAEIMVPRDFGLEPVLAAHDRDYVDFLASAWKEWLAGEQDALLIVLWETTESEMARQAAEAAVKVRDEFISIAAHELKTPVTSLQGFAQLMQRELGKTGTVNPERLAKAERVPLSRTYL